MHDKMLTWKTGEKDIPFKVNTNIFWVIYLEANDFWSVMIYINMFIYVLAYAHDSDIKGQPKSHTFCLLKALRSQNRLQA